MDKNEAREVYRISRGTLGHEQLFRTAYENALVKLSYQDQLSVLESAEDVVRGMHKYKRNPGMTSKSVLEVLAKIGVFMVLNDVKPEKK